VPKQQYPDKLVDFRSDAMPDHLGPKGFTVAKKAKREAQGLTPVDWEDTEGLGAKVDMEEIRRNGQARNFVGVGKVSGKNWKEAKAPMRSLRAAGRKADLSEIMKEREFKRYAKEQRAAAKEKRNEILRNERERRRRVREAKEARQKAAEVTVEVSTKTAKRMMKSKKQRKMLKTADTAKVSK